MFYCAFKSDIIHFSFFLNCFYLFLFIFYSLYRFGAKHSLHIGCYVINTIILCHILIIIFLQRYFYYQPYIYNLLFLISMFVVLIFFNVFVSFSYFFSFPFFRDKIILQCVRELEFLPWVERKKVAQYDVRYNENLIGPSEIIKHCN